MYGGEEAPHALDNKIDKGIGQPTNKLIATKTWRAYSLCAMDAKRCLSLRAILSSPSLTLALHSTKGKSTF
jgi:hypothetical protein